MANSGSLEEDFRLLHPSNWTSDVGPSIIQFVVEEATRNCDSIDSAIIEQSLIDARHALIDDRDLQPHERQTVEAIFQEIRQNCRTIFGESPTASLQTTVPPPIPRTVEDLSLSSGGSSMDEGGARAMEIEPSSTTPTPQPPTAAPTPPAGEVPRTDTRDLLMLMFMISEADQGVLVSWVNKQAGTFVVLDEETLATKWRGTKEKTQAVKNGFLSMKRSFYTYEKDNVFKDVGKYKGRQRHQCQGGKERDVFCVNWETFHNSCPQG